MISIAIQKCIACTEAQFLQQVKLRKRNHCLSLDTGFTTARCVNMEKCSISETVNKEFWTFGEYGDKFGKPKNAFFTPKGGNDTIFARSFNRIKEGINKNQVASRRPHLALGDNFPYKPGDAFHFLGSKGGIGLGCIAEVSGSKCSKYRVVHSGTRSTILASDYIYPTEKTKKRAYKTCSP